MEPIRHFLRLTTREHFLTARPRPRARRRKAGSALPPSPNAFTLVPERIAASATELNAISRQAPGAGSVDVGSLPLLADAPFIGHFLQAVAAALSSQSSNVAHLNEYGTGAAAALRQLVAAVTEAEHSAAGALQRLGGAGGAR